MGTRRNGSAPTSNTIESQLAATTDRELLQASAPEVRPGVERRLGCVPACVGIVDQRLQTGSSSKRLLGSKVVVLQVERSKPGVVPTRFVTLPETVEESLLGHPVDVIGDASGSAFETGEHSLPAIENHVADFVTTDRRKAVLSAQALACSSRSNWSLERGGRRAVGQSSSAPEGTGRG